MSYSYTLTEARTFTVTHARHLAAKVATDLKRIQRFYSSPSDAFIAAYETEIIELLKNGYLASVTYGFKKNGQWIEPTLRYTAKDLGMMEGVDNDPGKIRAGADISGASFSSYLIYSTVWESLSGSEKEAFKATLPFQRTSADEPPLNGYMSNDRTYSCGGRALDRSSLRSY